MASAQDRALLMPELLEMILLQLPLHDLLVNAQGVNRLFHDLITSSQRLQQALFFRPIQSVSPGKVQVNELLLWKFRPWFEWIMVYRHRMKDCTNFRGLDWNSSNQRGEVNKCKEASWRRMLVAQPPIHDLTVKVHSVVFGERMCKKDEIKLEDGLRMDLLYDLVPEFVDNQHITQVIIKWHHYHCSFTPFHPTPAA